MTKCKEREKKKDRSYCSFYKQYIIASRQFIIIYLVFFSCLATMEVTLRQTFDGSPKYHMCLSLLVGI